MKPVLLVICLFIYSPGLSQLDFMKQQYSHRYVMDVSEILLDTSKSSYDTVVIWGTDEGDTTRFMYNDKQLTLYPIRSSTWHKHRKWRDKKGKDPAHYVDYIKRLDTNDKNSIYLRQDNYNEIYAIQFVLTDTGLQVRIENLDFGIPTYRFSWSSKVELVR